MSLGASRFLIKPMEMTEFLKEVQEVIEEHRKGRLVRKITETDQERLSRDYSQVLARKLDKKIRELEQEHNKLKQSEEKYRRLVEALRENYIFYTHDTNGVFTYVSPSVTTVLGYSQEDFLCHYTEYLVNKDLNEWTKYHTEQAISGKKQPLFELQILHKDGSIRLLEITEEAIFDKDGNVVAVEGIANDITKKKHLENKLRQVQKMEAIGTLAGGIAHDFNNILMGILGYCEIVKLKVATDSPVQNDIDQIINASNRAKDIVRQILTFSRQTEQGKKPVMVQYILKEALKLLRSSIPTTINFQPEIYPNCGAVLADPSQIHQVIMNLCTNAYHAMREHGGILAVKLSEIEVDDTYYLSPLDLKPGTYVKLEISDTGVGIEKHILEKIFDPYFTTKGKGEGTGLGLAIVHGIVKALDGHITVYSEPGKGSCFSVYLPQVEAQKTTFEEKNKKAYIGGDEHILLVDDEKQILELEKTILKGLGYQVTFLSDPFEALKFFKSDPAAIDLVITDMTMPGMSGANLAKNLIDIRDNIPIILCTGFSEVINEKKAKSLGIRRYIMKPVITHELTTIIREVLDIKPST